MISLTTAVAVGKAVLKFFKRDLPALDEKTDKVRDRTIEEAHEEGKRRREAAKDVCLLLVAVGICLASGCATSSVRDARADGWYLPWYKVPVLNFCDAVSGLEALNPWGKGAD